MSRNNNMEDVPEDHPIILFDGVCNLCNGLIKFIIPRDPEQVFRFAPLQSTIGKQLLDECGLPTDQMDTFVLVENGESYTKSDAALRIAAHLGGPYRLLEPFRFVPRPLRNRVYDVISEHRYQWFGRKDHCMMPSPDVESRFLAGGPASESADDV